MATLLARHSVDLLDYVLALESWVSLLFAEILKWLFVWLGACLFTVDRESLYRHIAWRD